MTKDLFVVEGRVVNLYTHEYYDFNTTTYAVSYEQAINNIRYRYVKCAAYKLCIYYIQPVLDMRNYTIEEPCKRKVDEYGNRLVLTDLGNWEEEED